MCTESSNQQRMWKDLLGETLRAFLARCIFFFFLKWEKKNTHLQPTSDMAGSLFGIPNVCSCEVLLKTN